MANSGSASQLKLSQRLKEKRLNKNLEDSIRIATFNSDAKSELQSQSSIIKNSGRTSGSRRYQEVRLSQEKNKEKWNKRPSYKPVNYGLYEQNDPKNDHSEGKIFSARIVVLTLLHSV
jgi:hypothetical protein